MQPALLLGPYDLADLMMLEVSLEDGMMSRSINRYLLFWNKAMPYSADIEFPFKKQFLVCHWAPVEIKC